MPAPARLRLYEAVEPHLGTLVRIKLYAASERQAKAAFRAAFSRIRQLEARLSDYQPDSELNQISRAAVGRPVSASYDLFRLLAASQELAEATGGAFDVTLGPVIRLWREARKTHQAPDAASLRAAAGHCGYGKLHLDREKRTVTLDTAGMSLDVGGIGKGYAADAALAVLERLGIRSALIAASGDIALSDAPPGQRGWKIGIDSFDRPQADFTSVLELSNAAVSTSGSTGQHLDAGGRRYSHIIDPASMVGITDDITVTIVARRGVDADGLATAVSVLGAARGIDLIERRPGVGALIVKRTGGVTEMLQSSAWRRMTAVGVLCKYAERPLQPAIQEFSGRMESSPALDRFPRHE